MGALFNIITNSIGSLLIGVTLTVVGVFLMFFLIHSWIRNASFTLFSFIIGVILFVFLSFQSVLICGAITIKSYSYDIEMYISTMVSYLPQDEIFSRIESQEILDEIGEEWPIVKRYVDYADFTGHTPATIAKAMTDKLNSYMNWYIVRRVGWSLLFIILGAVSVIRSIPSVNRKCSNTYNMPEDVF